MTKQELITNLKEYLKPEGIAFFQNVKNEHGIVDAVWSEGGIPHSVHFREGMQVRNFLRTQSYCEGWDAHRLDNEWVSLIEEAIVK